MWLRSTIRNKGRRIRSNAAAMAWPTRGLEVDFRCMILGNISQKIEACQPPGRRLRGVTDSWPRARGPIRRSNGKSEARTISAGWRSTASAETQDWVAALSKLGPFHDLSAGAE